MQTLVLPMPRCSGLACGQRWNIARRDGTDSGPRAVGAFAVSLIYLIPVRDFVARVPFPAFAIRARETVAANVSPPRENARVNFSRGARAVATWESWDDACDGHG